MATNQSAGPRRHVLREEGGVRAPKTADLVARRLRRLIIRGEIKEDEALPAEAQLLEDFQVSRPTMREAIRVLEAEGLIVVRRGVHGGARVRLPTEEVAARYTGLLLQYRGTTLRDVYAMRATVEAPAAAIVAARRRKPDLTRLWAAVAEAEGSEDISETLGCHHDFHALLIEMAGSQTMSVISVMLARILGEAATNFVAEPPSEATRRRLDRGARRTHERLIELIEARDAVAAEELWHRHLVSAGEEILKGLPETTVLELLT